ncbi:YggS family pyridoxal phosphate-dependent enzyme [Cryptosporangium aurantiacum]|uniref:YggS family pyridoxal phosphate-dependent enzyme n=1 Tax=Cryptosporangium aurantiacum TaxID=134849 RepID=UPI0009337330
MGRTGSADHGSAGPAPSAASPERVAELTAGLADVERRLSSACEDAGRQRAEVTLIAVTKTWPASDVAALAALGVRDVAENKDQEAKAKHAELTSVDLRWHFVGQLQRNKARSVVRYADVVHSVDRPELAAALAGASERHRERPLDVLLQVDLEEGASAGRGGVTPSAVAALAADVVASPTLRLLGLMAVAPLGGDPDRAFARLAELSAALREDHPEARWISAGMSSDLESAVRHGATHVRVGSALLGKRVSGHGSVWP